MGVWSSSSISQTAFEVVFLRNAGLIPPQNNLLGQLPLRGLLLFDAAALSRKLLSQAPG